MILTRRAISRIRNRHARTRPLTRVQIPYELGDIRPIGLIKRQQGVATGRVRQSGDGHVRAGEALCAVDGEGVFRVGGDGCVFRGEGNVVAADAEIRVLDVEVVGVAHGTVLEDGDADVACGKDFSISFFSLLFLDFHSSKGHSLLVQTSTGWVLLLTSVVFKSFQSMLSSFCKLMKKT